MRIGGAAVLGAATGLSYWLLRRPADEPAWVREIIDSFAPNDASMELGALYAAESASASPALLQFPDGVEPVQWLKDRIDADFAEERTRFVGGWVVADTEAELCAWLHMREA
jgi:hypothetical protein